MSVKPTMSFVRGRRDGAEREAPDERADEAVPARLDRHRVGVRSATPSTANLTERGCAPAPSSGRTQQRRADQPDAQADTDTDDEIDRRPSDALGVGDLRGDGARDEEVDERCRDAVVQSTLDVQHAPNARRDSLVLHDRRAKCGVGRGDNRTDERRDPQVDASEQHGRAGGARCDRKRQTDPEQTDGQGDVGPQRTHVDA